MAESYSERISRVRALAIERAVAAMGRPRVLRPIPTHTQCGRLYARQDATTSLVCLRTIHHRGDCGHA